MYYIYLCFMCVVGEFIGFGEQYQYLNIVFYCLFDYLLIEIFKWMMYVYQYYEIFQVQMFFQVFFQCVLLFDFYFFGYLCIIIVGQVDKVFVFSDFEQVNQLCMFWGFGGMCQVFLISQCIQCVGFFCVGVVGECYFNIGIGRKMVDIWCVSDKVCQLIILVG